MASPLDALWNQCDRFCRSQNIEPTSHAWFMIGALCMASIIQQPKTETAVEETYAHLKTFRDTVPFHGYIIPEIHAWNEV